MVPWGPKRRTSHEEEREETERADAGMDSGDSTDVAAVVAMA